MSRLKGLFGKEDTKVLDKQIIQSHEAPFSSMTYDHKKSIDPKKSISFFVGREDEIQRILQVIQATVIEGRAKAVVVEGPGGSGKSTLFGQVHELLRKGHNVDTSIYHVDLSQFLVVSAYVLAPSGAKSFKDFWKSIFEGLQKHDRDFFEHMACEILARLLLVFKPDAERFTELSVKIWGQQDLVPSDLKTDRMNRRLTRNVLREYISGSLEERIPAILQFVSENDRKILRYATVSVEAIDGKIEQFSLNRSDGIRKMKRLLSVLGKGGRTVSESLHCQDDVIIRNDDEAFLWFNWITSSLAWIHGRRPCFLIGIDDIGKVPGGQQEQEDYFYGFFNTLVRMRNALGRVVFTLIGTLADWQHMYSFIASRADLRSQVEGFIAERVSLSHLEPELAISVLENRMKTFWDKCERRPNRLEWYPFDKEAFRYVYAYKGHQIRDSLALLNRIWQSWRRRSAVHAMMGLIAAMETCRKMEDNWPTQFSVDQFHEFEQKALITKFWDRRTFSTDGQRSGACEEALATAFQAIAKQEHPRRVDRARTKTHIHFLRDGEARYRIPDVFVEFFGQLGPERARKVEFQVKIYETDSSVGSGDLDSSFELLDYGANDLLYLVMTGAGLSHTARTRVESPEYRGRVMGLSPLNREQIFALVLLVNYTIITGVPLDLATAKSSLELILAQSWDEFTSSIRNMPKNYGKDGVPLLLDDIDERSLQQGTGSLSSFLRTEDQMIREENGSTSAANNDAGEDDSILVSADAEVIAASTVDTMEDTRTAKTQQAAEWTDAFLGEFSKWEADLEHIFRVLVHRGGRYRGQATLNHLLKNLPAEVSRNRIQRIFKELPSQCPFFERKKSSIHLTEEGRDFAAANSLS